MDAWIRQWTCAPSFQISSPLSSTALTAASCRHVHVRCAVRKCWCRMLQQRENNRYLLFAASQLAITQQLSYNQNTTEQQNNTGRRGRSWQDKDRTSNQQRDRLTATEQNRTSIEDITTLPAYSHTLLCTWPRTTAPSPAHTLNLPCARPARWQLLVSFPRSQEMVPCLHQHHQQKRLLADRPLSSSLLSLSRDIDLGHFPFRLCLERW